MFFMLGIFGYWQRARALGDYLIVGVSSDALNFSKNNVIQYILKSEMY